MKVSVALVAALCAAAAALAMQAPAAEGSHLKVGYYSNKCRGVEDVVKYHVAKAIEANRKNGAALVRLIFHDCFVRVRTQSFPPRSLPASNHIHQQQCTTTLCAS
jgi:peroxidase